MSRDPVLIRFLAALEAAYGDRLERAVLFGSRARGEERPDSDYDVAVFLKGSDGWFEEIIRLASLTTDILMETGAVISAKPFLSGRYEQTSPVMRAIQREGQVL